MKHRYGEIDFLITVVTLGIYYIADWGSDTSTIVALFRSGKSIEGFITFGSIIFASYSLNALQSYWDKRDYGCTCMARIFYILPLGLLYQRYRCMGLLLPIVFYKKYMKEVEDEMQQQLLLEDWKSIKLALIQTTLPNYIHVVWNFHPIFINAHRATDLQRAETATVVISFLVCVIGLSDYHHHRHIVLRTLKDVEMLHNIVFRCLNLLSTGLMLVARFIVCTAVLSNEQMVLPFLVTMAVHYGLTVIFIIWKDWDAFLKHEIPRKPTVEKAIEDSIEFNPNVTEWETSCCKWFGKFLLSLILLGSPIHESFKYPVNLIYLVENVCLIIGWYFTLPAGGEWELEILITIIVSNVIGVVLCFVMWKMYLKKRGDEKPHVLVTTTISENKAEMVPFTMQEESKLKPPKNGLQEAALTEPLNPANDNATDESQQAYVEIAIA